MYYIFVVPIGIILNKKTKNISLSINSNFEDYCVNYLNENIEDSSWNHDDYFWSALKELRDPYEYFGI